MNPIEFADRYLYPYKIRGNEINSTCPICNGGERSDKNTFHLNTEKETYHCKRASCSAKGTFSALCKKFEEESDSTTDWKIRTKREAKQYKKPITKLKPATSKVEEYMKLRKISKSTYQKAGVSEDNNGNIIFPYYRDKELVFVKFRPARKIKKGEQKMWREKDTEPIFWNMDNCVFDEPLTITEGELDALAVMESGNMNVTSVPSGANDMTCLDTCWDWIQKFDSIIIWSDNDQGGYDMQEKLIQKLGEWRCYTVTTKYKDANEVLYNEGKEAVLDIIASCEEVKPVGVLRLSDVKHIDYTNIERIKSTFGMVNYVLGGYMMGDLSVWTGVNSSGKSTLLGNEMLTAINEGHSICVYSGELRKERFKRWIDLQASGFKNLDEHYSEIKGTTIPLLRQDIVEKINSWYYNKFFLFDSKHGIANETELFKVFEYCYKRFGCTMFVIDNMMMVKIDSTEDMYEKQKEFMLNCKAFVERFNVHLHLVAHPRKSEGRITKMDIKGSGHITDIADNVLAVHRLSKKEQEEDKYNNVDNIIQVFKNREDGIQDVEIMLKFDEFSKRFWEQHDKEGASRKLGWENAIQ